MNHQAPHQGIQAMTFSSMMIVVRKEKTLWEISSLVFLVKIFIINKNKNKEELYSMFCDILAGFASILEIISKSKRIKNIIKLNQL
jgi:hypothetical protein